MKIRRNFLKFGITAGLVALALAVVLAGVLPALAASIVEDYANVEGVKYLPGDEVVELRDQYSSTFLTETGKRWAPSLGSIHYEDASGNFQPINTTIVPSSKPNWDWEVTTGHWQLFVNNNTTVGVKKGNNWIGTRLHGIAYYDVSTKDYTILQTANSVVPVVSGNAITWYNILYGVDYVLYYTADSLKEDIIIHQEARDLLSSAGHRPSDYGYIASNTFLVPIFECDWSESLPMKLVWEGLDGFEIPVDPEGIETSRRIYFEDVVEDPYWKTKLVSFLPVYMATSVNPINPSDPEEEWEYAECVMKQRLVKKNNKHWLLTGVPVLTLNAMPEGSIIFDPTETLRPDATGDETSIDFQYPASTSHYDKVDEETPDTNTYVYVTAASHQRDLYDLPAHSVGSGTITSIKIYFRCHKVGVPACYAEPSQKSGTTTTDGSEITLTTTWTTYSQTYTTNPATGLAYIWDEIDALQIGVSLKADGAFATARCTQVYVEVDYTGNPPTVTTQAATNIEDTTATGNGNITSIGGGNATRRGFCYMVGTSGDPTTADSVAYDDGSFGTGPYTKAIAGLNSGTSYRVRAYAVNPAGTAYGTTVQILTLPDPPTNVSATDGVHTDKVTVTWTKSTGATGYKVYEGVNLLDTLGDVATYDDIVAPAPTITPGSAVASDGTSATCVALSLTGASANNGASRTYKVVAFNGTGDSGDSLTDTGYRGVGVLTYQWQKSSGDGDAGYSNISGATNATYNDTAAPQGSITPGSAVASDGSKEDYVGLSLSGTLANNGAGRYYKCVLNADGATQQTSAPNRGYRGTGLLTYQWQRTAEDADATYFNISGATGATYNDTGAPADGTGRYYQCVIDATGATQQTSASDRGYRSTGTPSNILLRILVPLVLFLGPLWGMLTSLKDGNIIFAILWFIFGCAAAIAGVFVFDAIAALL